MGLFSLLSRASSSSTKALALPGGREAADDLPCKAGDRNVMTRASAWARSGSASPSFLTYSSADRTTTAGSTGATTTYDSGSRRSTSSTVSFPAGYGSASHGPAISRTGGTHSRASPDFPNPCMGARRRAPHERRPATERIPVFIVHCALQCLTRRRHSTTPHNLSMVPKRLLRRIVRRQRP
jgi:hypothetical protein